MKRIFCIIIIVISMFSVTHAHSGRTDSNGGHYDRSTGEYHYHNGDYTESYEEINDTEGLEGVNTLIVDDTAYINSLESKVNTLQEQIHAKENSIESLNNELEEKNKEIKTLETNKNNLHYLYILIILVMGILIYKTKKEDERKSKEIIEYKKLEKILQDNLGTTSIQNTINVVEEFYKNQQNNEQDENK